jgi:hypothetical protein
MRLLPMAVAVARLQVVTVATVAAGQVELLLVVQLTVQVTQVARDPAVLLLLVVRHTMAAQVVLLAALVAVYQRALRVRLRAAAVADRSLTKTSTTRLSLGPQAVAVVVVVTQPVRLFRQQAQAPALFYRIRLALRGPMQAVAAQVPLAS